MFAIFTFIAQAQKPKLFIGATAHLGNGEVIENSAISIYNGKFELVADASVIRIDPSAFDTIIRIHGDHIYPAFIVPNTTLGITEIGAVRASNDYKETGNFNPNVRTLIAYNTDSKIIKTVRTNGVLIAQVTPEGGLISGQSSVMYLDGWNVACFINLLINELNFPCNKCMDLTFFLMLSTVNYFSSIFSGFRNRAVVYWSP